MIDRARLVADLLERARAGKRPTGIGTGSHAPDVIELIGAFKFDWLLLDSEHSPLSTPAQLTELIRAADLWNLPTIVKLPTWNPLFASDALDAGACGIQVPFVDNLAKLREVVSACRFKPIGTRGYCPLARGAGYGVQPGASQEFVDFQNRHILIIPMIESPEAVDNLDEMLASSPDCPVFSIGPEDLRVALDVPADAEGMKYMDRVLRAMVKKIHAAGKLMMLPIFGPSHNNTAQALAEDLEDMHNDLPYSVDTVCLAYGFEQMLKIRQLGADYAAKKRQAG